MKILNFGSLNIDKVYGVDQFVRPGETKTAKKLETFAGGKGLNQSIAIARAGSKVWHAGMIGEEGVFLKDALEQSGVDTSLIKLSSEDTGHAIIQVNDQGQNCILLYSGANHAIDKAYIEQVLHTLEKGDLLVLQNEISELEFIIDKAYEKGLNIVLNPSPIDERLKTIDLSKITYIVLNEIEGKELTGETEPEEIAYYFINHFPNLKVVLTLGEDGVVYKDTTCYLKRPRYCVQAVDTTAAGDTFTGYFIAEIATGKGVEVALEQASKAAALCVTRHGAAPAIPTCEEVKHFNS